MSAPCTCPLAGYCERHQREKGQHLFHLCQTRDDYRALWDAQAEGREYEPTLAEKAARLATALTRWTLAGSPKRTDEEVATIFETICAPCEHFKAKSDGAGSCKLCGCALRKEGGLLNKIAMKTEHCPAHRW